MRRPGHRVGALVIALTITSAVGHRSAASFQSDDGVLSVLFIGNSLTAANDLPAMVEAIGETSGWKGRLLCRSITRPNFSLQDHWDDGEARRAIRDGRWTHVVLQQGPSSLPESQQQLRESTARFAREARARGSALVLYGVWPPRARLAFQPAVTESYRRAAADAGGMFVAAGEGWAAAWAVDASLPLYAADQFHPSPQGTYLAAVMFFEALTGSRAKPLTAVNRRPSPLGRVDLDDAQQKIVIDAARATNTALLRPRSSR